jgi:hypothetical protein
MGVMNQGLGGNRILHDIRGDSGLRRFDRDVLAQPGVTHAIVMLPHEALDNATAPRFTTRAGGRRRPPTRPSKGRTPWLPDAMTSRA